MGKQGLWPGRRFTGMDGTTALMCEMEALQLDPLIVIARSQEIAMQGRVLDYRIEDIYTAAYERREFFDYGGTLFLYPIHEVPYWRLHMQHRRADKRWQTFMAEHPESIQQVKDAIRANGPMANRDFKGNKAMQSYRGGKDTSVALYALWITGEVMIHHRNGFDRVYDLTERVLPAEFNYDTPVKEAEDFFARKTVAFMGLMREKRWRASFASHIYRKVDAAEAKKRLAELYERDEIIKVNIEGDKEPHIALKRDLALLEELDAGRVPGTWLPLGPGTQDEVTFVAPLEIVSARGRAKEVFDFEYVWEVYKPAEERRWGYYVLPILYGDDLVGRLDPKLDRKTMTLQIKGFWLEDDTVVDAAFADALGKGLARFVRFVHAKQVDMDALPVKLREHLKGVGIT